MKCRRSTLCGKLASAGVLQAMAMLHAEIVATLASLEQSPSNGGHG
jgi:hypothetical protein